MISDHAPLSSFKQNGDVREMTCEGQPALHCRSAHASLELSTHHLGHSKGHLVLWFYPLEELSQHPQIWRCVESNGIGHTIPLLTDRAEDGKTDPAHFSMFWQPSWGHPFVIKFAQGRFFPDMHWPDRKVMIEGWIETLKRGHWYRLDLAWDHDASYHALFLNGILAGRSNQHARREAGWDSIGSRLFLRSPQIAYGSLRTYAAPLEEGEIARQYEQESPESNHSLDQELRRHLTGEGNPRRDLKQESMGWSPAWELDLCRPSQEEHFYLQGCPDGLNWEPEGLRISTPQEEPFHPREGDDLKQLYLWSRRMFHGDLYIGYDFMPLEHGGLSILIPRASGMQGENFLEDYPPRTDGSMKTIHSSDIRMYHWEFFREMDDVRNDVPTHAIVKWPWQHVLAGGVGSSPFHLGKWNRIEFLQTGEAFCGTVNGEVVIEGKDAPYSGKGPTLRHGVFAIRCMIRTSVRLRNLEVRTGPEAEG